MGRLGVRTAAALLAALVAVGLGLEGADRWAAPRRLLVAMIVVAAGLAAVATIGSAVREFRGQRTAARTAAAELTLTATLWAIVDLTSAQGRPLDYRDLGVALYRLVEPVRPWARLLGRTAVPVLRRVHRVRAKHRTSSSTVLFTVGKGVVGSCVTQRQVVAQDFGALSAELGRASPAEWAALPAETRLELTYRDYLDLRGKYDVVVAVPARGDSGTGTVVLGAIALDGPPASLEALTDPAVVGQLDTSARGLLGAGL